MDIFLPASTVMLLGIAQVVLTVTAIVFLIRFKENSETKLLWAMFIFLVPMIGSFVFILHYKRRERERQESYMKDYRN